MIGRTLGNYQIKSLLGEGGMGRVYLAEHPAIGRKAAVKVMHAHLATDPNVISRFLTEARASNEIKHPSIVDIYDLGTMDDGAPYIVMEFLDGETLAELLRKQTLTPNEALDLACQVGEGLQAAHLKGIVHRDLKPENLYVVADERDPNRRQAKILDFGIAKLQKRLGVESHKTRTGTLLGTPLFMSPEQCLGVKEVDHRSDIYSLGCIVYQMSCGRPPFESEGVGALINMHINQPPDPPRALNPSVSPELDRVILKSLTKSPEARYQSMAEFVGALHAALVAGQTLAPAARAQAVTSVTPAPHNGPSPHPTTVSYPSGVMTTLSGGAQQSLSGSSKVAGEIAAVARRKRGVGLVAGLVAAGVVTVVLLIRFAGPAAQVDPTRVAATPGAGAPGAPGAGAPGVASPGTSVAGAQVTPPVGVPPTAPAAPVPPPSEAAPIEIALGSEPEGATVTLDGVVVGTTPATFSARSQETPIALVFTLDGYEPQTVKVLVSPGLKLKPRLVRQPKPLTRSPARRAASAPTPAPRPRFDDIKSER